MFHHLPALALFFLTVAASAQGTAMPITPLATSINEFGLDLLQATAADPQANTVISPVSVHAALSMTVNGATGETAAQILHTLHAGNLGPSDLSKQWAALQTDLASRSPVQTLSIANALWGNPHLQFNKSFIERNRSDFSAEIRTLNFSRKEAVSIINGWIAENTRQMIPKMLDQLADNTALLLTNAVYFKGDWDTPFKHETTTRAPFTLPGNTRKEVDTMHATWWLPFVRTNELSATRLRYKGNDSAFYILLPEPGTTPATALASLRGKGFASLRQTLGTVQTVRVILALPKLDTNVGTDLSAPLARLGMRDAFSPEKAAFDAMVERAVLPLYLGSVLHKARLRVDENGSEAAAATVAALRAGSATPRDEPQYLICDRPFAFIIADENSGAMLFAGVVNDPAP